MLSIEWGQEIDPPEAKNVMLPPPPIITNPTEMA